MMDGNRRWALKNKIESFLGHKNGVKSAEIAVNFCLDNNIKILSLYTLSIENLKRSEEEKKYLFNLLIEENQKNLEYYISKGVKVRFVGDRSLFPINLVDVINQIEFKTHHLDKLQLNLLFCYGSRQEILSAAKLMAQDFKDGKISLDNITIDNFTDFFWPGNLPDPELVIRTGGEFRVSNFMLYQLAYSELYFIEKLWPELTYEDFKEALKWFSLRKRRFGA